MDPCYEADDCMSLKYFHAVVRHGRRRKYYPSVGLTFNLGAE